MYGTKKQRQARRKRRHGSQFVRKIRGGRCGLLYLRRGSQVRYRGPDLYSCPLDCYSSNRRHYDIFPIAEVPVPFKEEESE